MLFQERKSFAMKKLCNVSQTYQRHILDVTKTATLKKENLTLKNLILNEEFTLYYLWMECFYIICLASQ